MAEKRGTRSFKVDARALLSLGRESIKDHTTALVELIKNSYDADAENVDVEILSKEEDGGIIRIADDGLGMTSADINEKWLRIGFSEKRKRRISKKGRRETGEKGIGRLSADRLGASLELRSITANGEVVNIGVDWNQFDVDGAEISAVPVVDLPAQHPLLPRHGGPQPASGTEIVISELRQPWTVDDVVGLERELSTLIPASAAAGDFAIWLRTEAKEQFRRLGSAFAGKAELELKGELDSRGRFEYRVTERAAQKGKPRRVVAKDSLSFSQLVPGWRAGYRIGPVKIELAYFLRAGVSLEDFSLTDLREYLDSYGGVRVYRDRIRVKPYGDPKHSEGDWLGLAERKSRNPAGAARKEFRIAANQLVGAVFIGRDSNPTLSDSAAREGLVHGESYATLRAAILGCVWLLESIYHSRFTERKKDVTELSLPTVVEQIRANVAAVMGNLEKVGNQSESAATNRLVQDSVQKVANIAAQISAAGRGIDDLASQATVYRGLATVGISAAVFGHETESALGQARLSSSLALDALQDDSPDLEECEDELTKAVSAIERVALWGQFALSRVKRDKRKRTNLDVTKILQRLVRETKPLFAASTIALDHRIEADLEFRGFAMDIEALVLNLMTNAYHAARFAKRNRRVLISAAKRSRPNGKVLRISVSDSGPGIAKQHIDRIWAPLFSTRLDESGKSSGTGLGLTIVRSIVADLGAKVDVAPKGELGGATFEILIPLRG